MIQIQRILAPTDFSDYSNQALTYAVELANRFDAELHLLHVTQPVLANVSYGGPIPDEQIHPELVALTELKEVEAPGLEQVAHVEHEVRTGPTFLEIIRYAKDNDIDLIVIGTHGRTGLAHAIIGSVAERVVRKAPCPVLTVRPEGHQFIMP